MIAELMH